MPVMTLMTLPISALDRPRLLIVELVPSAMRTASSATRAASLAFLAISLMLEPISSMPLDTACTLLLISSAAVATEEACTEASWAKDDIWALVLIMASDEEAMTPTESRMRSSSTTLSVMISQVSIGPM